MDAVSLVRPRGEPRGQPRGRTIHAAADERLTGLVVTVHSTILISYGADSALTPMIQEVEDKPGGPRGRSEPFEGGWRSVEADGLERRLFGRGRENFACFSHVGEVESPQFFIVKSTILFILMQIISKGNEQLTQLLVGRCWLESIFFERLGVLQGVKKLHGRHHGGHIFRILEIVLK
jgi:hypothetical protein